MNTTAPLDPCRPSPRGMTLLEVLISCGVLVVGLASIASLLPAAGSRLGQATTEDRAGTLAANARTDAFARGLVAFDLFTDPAKSIGFGKGMTTLPTISGAQFAAPAATPLAQRIDPQRGFLLEDAVMYAAPTTAETPSNEFENGRRSFKEGLCWGATLVPQVFPAKAGAAAVLGLAVFRKEPTPRAIALTQHSGDLYRMTTAPPTLPATGTTPPTAADEATLKQFLKSCSYVLVPSTNPAQGPRWFRIASSWRPAVNQTTGQRQNDGCYVVFAETGFAGFAGSAPTVIAFENLIRVDQSNVILQ
jgi:hypothetical protein